jgi:hypothetical protein
VGAAALVGGTYAKYITSADTKDQTAHVAKFGVTVSAEGDLFGKTYYVDYGSGDGAANSNKIYDGETASPITDNDDALNLSVVSSANVVAPGTQNDDGLTFSITGNPEVAVKVEVGVTDPAGTGTPKDIYLGTGNDAYYPIKYTLKKGSTVVKAKLSEGETAIEQEVEGVTLAQLVTALKSLSKERLDPNTNLGTTYGTYTITWEWPYEATDESTDTNDTILGNLAAGVYPNETYTATSGNYSTSCDFKLSITVTQID